MEGDSTSGVSWLWRAAAAVFVLINLGGMIWAIAMGEPSHGLVHVALLFGGYLGWKFLSRRSQARCTRVRAGVDPRSIEYLQQSIDAVARRGRAHR
jgi:ABC-type polysaccharide/polyol phosphate export permease